ncbi:hypothetical protein, variant [Aphanomyces invadans]|uniref:Uncharacterized protein n=1 Tax=Aphanomyces invadans TaxID=157072 RepID=A0A024UT00_9STRA|nr:hypothetical protein, variant [Aphanomyces invadans]ETW09042.1 hypothetical protein, variant [Aphanomyces invadans]|eukprot:XP_008862847.1 hypothetical protein, variant [Aphanomyces invadans]
MDFLQGKRLLTTAADPQASNTSPIFTRSPMQLTSSTMGAAPTSPPQNAFKKRRKAQDRFCLSPLQDSSSTPGLAVIAATNLSPSRRESQRTEDSRPVDPTRDTLNDCERMCPTSMASSPVSILQKSTSDVRQRTSKSRDPLVPHATRTFPSCISINSPPKNRPIEQDSLQMPSDISSSSMEIPAPVEALQKSLISTFWSRHITPPSQPWNALSVATAGAVQLDEDIRAYCQRGPVSRLSRTLGKTWLTNMLRAYDMPSTLAHDDEHTAAAERQLALVVAQAQAHFHPGENKLDEFVTALFNAVANEIWDSCTHDFVHTVAGHYRDLLTNLPALLKERDTKLLAATKSIRHFQNKVVALQTTMETLARDNAALQTRIDRADENAKSTHDTIQDLEGVLRDAVAAELAATALAKQLELQVREVENSLDLKTQAYDQLTADMEEMNHRCLGLERTVLDTKQLLVDATQDRDSGLLQIKELTAQSAQLGRDLAALNIKISDMHVEQQVLHLRLNAEATQSERPPPAHLGSSPGSMSQESSNDAITAALQRRIEELQDQVFRQSIDLANKEKAFRSLQNEQDHKDQLLKRLDEMIEAAKAENNTLQSAHDALLVQRDALKLRLDALRADDGQGQLKRQVQQLTADRIQLLEELARIVLERDVALDDLARGRRKLENMRRHLAVVVIEVKRLRDSHDSLRVAVTKQLQGCQSHLVSVSMSVNATMAKVAAREAGLSHDIFNMQRATVQGDPVFRYTLQLFQKQLRRIRASWTDLRHETASGMNLLATYHLENTQHVQRLAKHAHDKLTQLQKPKPKKHPFISIPSTKSMKQIGIVSKATAVNTAHRANATTQTTVQVALSQGATSDVAEHVTNVLLPVIEATERKLMAVMDKVERQKMDLLAAYEREAELRNLLDNSSASPPLIHAPVHPYSQPSHDRLVRKETPDVIVLFREKLLSMTTGDENAHLASHVADLYDMLHANLDELEAALDDGPALYLQRRDSHGSIVADSFNPVALNQQTNMPPCPSRHPFKQSKTSSRTLFPGARSDPPLTNCIQQVDASKSSFPHEDGVAVPEATSSTFSISVHDGEIQNLPVAVRKRVHTAVLKLAATALFQDDINVNDIASLLIASDPNADVSSHGVEDIRDDQLIQNNVSCFSLAATGSNLSHDAPSNESSNHQKTRFRQVGDSGAPTYSVPAVKVVTRLLELVGEDVHASEKNAGDATTPSKTWLLKQIRSIYHDKYIAESLEHAAFNVVLALPEFIVQWAFLKFGVNELVSKNCHAIMNGANAWKASIPEVSLFAAFLAEKGQFGFGKSDLSLFLHARQLVMNCVGDLQALGHDDMPQLTSTQAQNIVHRVFQTLVHGHRHLILAKLEGLLKPITHLPEEDVASVHQDPAPQDKLSESPSTLPCFNFQGLPASTSAASSGHFPQGNVKKAIPSHVPDPKLILDSALDSSRPFGEEKWIDVHQLLLFCVLEFREERRRFFTDMQGYVANKKLREDVAKATFDSMMHTLFEWTPSICELIFEEASQHGLKKTVESDGTVLVDCQHLMCMALQYYTNLFALARFTDGLSVDQTEDPIASTDTSFTLQAAPRFRARDVSRVCQ